MYTINQTIFRVMGQNVRKNSNFSKADLKRWFERVKKDPLLFMQFWCIPPIIHHIIFNWLNEIVPLIHFCAGIVFTISVEVYIFLLLMHVPFKERNDMQRHQNPPRHLPVDEKLKFMKDGVQKNNSIANHRQRNGYPNLKKLFSDDLQAPENE